MKLDEILEPGEEVIVSGNYSGNLFDREYDKLALTDQRFIFYKKKKSTFVPLSNITNMTIEEKGTFSKTGVLNVDIGMEEPIELKGDPSKVKALYHKLYAINN